MPPKALQAQAEGLLVRVHVQPKASKTDYAGLHGDRLKIRVKAAPAEGKANLAVRELLAEFAGFAASCVEIVRGTTSRDKDIMIRCSQPDKALERICFRLDPESAEKE